MSTGEQELIITNLLRIMWDPTTVGEGECIILYKGVETSP